MDDLLRGVPTVEPHLHIDPSRGAGRSGLTRWRSAAAWAVAAALAVGCRPAAHRAPVHQRVAAPPSIERGLSTETAFVTVSGPTRSALLAPGRAGVVIDAVWRIIGNVPSVTAVAGGPRVLATLRLNEQVVDVAVWKPLALAVGLRRFPNVSGIVIPVTGRWRHRVLLVQGAHVVASPPLVDSLALATIDDTVQTVIGPR